MTLMTRRELNRATLARQMLLTRADVPIVEAVERLAGLQAQTPHSWYSGFASRLADVRPEQVGELLERREIVRLALMRSTIHLVSAQDCLWMRPLVQPALDRDLFRNQIHGESVQGLDMDELLAAARPLLEEAPQTSKQLGALLAEHGKTAGWGERVPASLAYAARNRMALVQVPPRGVWGKSGPIAHTTAESWLGRPLATDASPDDLVLRYLGAFGPATVKDVQTWSGLTRLAEIMDRLRPGLVTFTGEDGRELFDLPDAPRPAADHPAPPRLLYEFDNLLLSHADRSRVITEEHLAQRYGTRRPLPGWVLVDGFTGGEWQIGRQGESAVLTIRTFAPPVDGLAEEGERFLKFAHADATHHEVRLEQI